MENIDLKDIISNVKQPTFDDDMIKKLADGLINKNNLMKDEDSFYEYIQKQTAICNFKSKIDRDEEQELFKKKAPGYNDQNTFQHMGSLSDIDYCISRLYINCDQQDLMKLANLFTDRCKNKKLPIYFKYVSNNNSYRSDQIVIYSNLKELENYIQILQEIGKENQDIIERCGEPPLLTGTIDEWIGIGDEPINGESFTQLRSNIIYNVLKENAPQIFDDEILSYEYSTKNLDYDKIKEELRKAFEDIGININTFAFNNKNLQLYMSDEKTRLNYDAQRKQKNKEHKEEKQKEKKQEKQDLRERIAIQELKILDKMGVMPEVIKDMNTATYNRNNFLNDLYKNKLSNETIKKHLGLSNNIVISDDFEIKNQTEFGKIDLRDEQREEIISKLMNDVTNYYVEYVDDKVPLMDNILNQYTELFKKEDYKSREKLVDLDSTLKVLANGKDFFETIGIPTEKIELTCDRADSFLNKLDKQIQEETKMETEKGKSKIDRELLSIFFEESGITDKEELRKLYESWENFEVSSEDLEAVLSNFDNKEYLEKTRETSNDNDTVSHKLNKPMGTTYEQRAEQQTKTRSQSFRDSVASTISKGVSQEKSTRQQNKSAPQNFRETVPQDTMNQSHFNEETEQQTKTSSQKFRDRIEKMRSDNKTGMTDVKKAQENIALRKERERLLFEKQMGQLDEDGKRKLEEINRLIHNKNINTQQYENNKRKHGQSR